LATAAGTISELVCACEELGGTAYGGAGPGSGKLPPPRIATSGAGLDVLAELKRVIDPKGIMNPGKMTYEA
jgi:FAD/FMN-containing dehydrogenase